MSSLADLDKIIGFFSYSRQDDDDSAGALSKLRDRIYRELAMQLGHRDFRLWQDKSAIAFGEIWKRSIKTAVADSVFFIPVVTPRAVASQYCKFEFDSFLAREGLIGRSDLVFPILYIDVPGLNAEVARRDDDILKLINERQYVDWRQFRYRDINTPDVSEKIGQFCANIVEALRRPWEPPQQMLEAQQQNVPPERVDRTKTTVTETTGRDIDRTSQSNQTTTHETIERTSPGPFDSGGGGETIITGGGSTTPPPPPPPKLNLTYMLGGGIAAFAVIVGIAIWALTPHNNNNNNNNNNGNNKPQISTTTTVCEGGIAIDPLSVRTPAPLSTQEECGLKPRDAFKECTDCPEMVVIPPGSYTMGSSDNEAGRDKNESPRHSVTIAKPFAVARYDITRDQFAAFVADTGYETGTKCYVWTGKWEEKAGVTWLNPTFQQAGNHPAVCVNWYDAGAFVNWLNKKTGKSYRLLSESEYEYATRAATTTAYYWGNELGAGNANCHECGSQYDAKSTSPVGSFKPNDFGLYDMVGNVRQLVEDCWNATYDGAPADNSARTTGDCDNRVNRGGSWNSPGSSLRSAARTDVGATFHLYDMGIRVGRNLGQ
ncbi:MAG: SUMF1/EgtB/PvdO family nonheme iron enzyme [Methylovirgula sp.]|jgi:formylglycine-generating enzyme required for sulfatase activity